MIVKLRSKPLQGDRVVEQVFVGEDEDHLQLAGELHLHAGEATLLGAALVLGAKETNGHLRVITDDASPPAAGPREQPGDRLTVERAERGWVGHFICGHRCRFRRNTLLECGDVRIVVSTVGLMRNMADDGFEEIGHERYYETMAFHAERVADRYWDADVARQVYFESEWAIAEIDADDKANDMHEAVVVEIAERLASGDRLAPAPSPTAEQGEQGA